MTSQVSLRCHVTCEVMWFLYTLCFYWIREPVSSLRVRCLVLGPRVSPHTPCGSRSRPAGGGTWPGRPGTAARPPPAPGIEPETR